MAEDFDVETFAALCLHVDTWRWCGVPFYIRAGKSMPITATEVRVIRKSPPLALFEEASEATATYVRFRLGLRIDALAKASPKAQRLMQLPGVGTLTATAVLATVGAGRDFRNGRQFAAWLGLTPRQFSSAGKTRLGRITKRGDVHVRTLLVHGARSIVRLASQRDDPRSRWISELRERRGFNKAAVALAAKNARILWAMLARGENYHAPKSAPNAA